MSNCIFCKIANGEIPSDKLYEDEDMIAFRDIAPQAPVHFLVVPKRHIVNLMGTAQTDTQLLGKMAWQAGQIAAQEGCKNGARFVFNSGPDGGQTVDHLHLHVLGRRALDWPPG